MKTIFSLIFYFAALSFSMFAADYTISINGTTYSPSSLTVKVGDNVTISASTMHPLVQVSEATWNANESAALVGGWGTKSAKYTFTVSAVGKIYFVCSMHVSIGMKGFIVVEASNTGINESTGPENLSLYPNPATSELKLTFYKEVSKNILIRIYNLNGQLVKNFSSLSEIMKDKNRIDLIFNDLQNGVYFISINDAGKKYFRKFMIVK